MTHLIADRRDIDFVLFEQFMVQKIVSQDKYSDFDRKTFEMIISEARKLAVNEILPTFKEADENGAVFENGKVRVPECFRRPYRLFAEGGWTAMTADPALGGQGLPHLIAAAASEYLCGANYAFGLYGFEGHAAGRMIEVFGTEVQKRLFLKKMYTGEWGGTMDLTEPGAGSDVGALTTTARKNADGTYSIFGSKIFITSGEQDLVENIIHPVLARIEGAPAGTRGISLFIVPKIWVNADGSLGEDNDIVCTGIEKKMGIHGSATCALTYGSRGQCRGLLLGEENKGMKAMFLMMNAARLLVGFQGFACATTSYMYALDYAKNRIQGRDLMEIMNPDAQSVAIIRHPDVRRQLMMMKTYVEAMRSLLYYVHFCSDMAKHAPTPAEREKYQGFVEVLTPIAKGYVTDRSFEVCSQGMQVYGGYGFIEEYPMAQLLRDCRITMIYEGTNGIQAMDLLGRKLGLNKGKPIMDLFGEMQKTVAQAKAIPALEKAALKVEEVMNKLAEVAIHMGQTAMSAKVLAAFANAHPFQDATGDTTMAWMLLWRATVAAQNLEKAKKKDQPFYQGIIKSLEFYVETQLPITLGRFAALMNTCSVAVDIEDSMFPS